MRVIRSPDPQSPMPARWLIVPLALVGLVSCGGDKPAHPWLSLPPDAGHEIVESTGVGGGQIVIAMNPAVTPEEALALGRLIESQAPPGITVNARLYNDAATARNWRTVAADWTLQHHWVSVVVIPQNNRSEVRWVGPSQDSVVAGAAAPPG